eukprot:3803149-Prymnesium_polylepis.1
MRVRLGCWTRSGASPYFAQALFLGSREILVAGGLRRQNVANLYVGDSRSSRDSNLYFLLP